MFIFISYQTTLLDQVKLDASFACPKCQSEKWLLNTEETTTSLFFKSMWQVRAKVVCEGCGKKIPKKYWSSEIRQLALSKEAEFKPSFMKRYGFFIILLVLFATVVTIPTVQAILEHKKLVNDAKENFSKTYGQDAKKAWLDNIQPGDFILCNKDYYDPARVFQIKEIMADSLIITEFEQSVPRTDFEDVDKLNQMVLGTGDSHDIGISKRDFIRNIIALDDDSRNNLMIQQIRKKK